MSEDEPTDDISDIKANMWYRLTVGATVPSTFYANPILDEMRLGIESLKHRQPEGRNQKWSNLAEYKEVMRVSGLLIVDIIGSTQTRMDVNMASL
jgi:hypothetical protein